MKLDNHPAVLHVEEHDDGTLRVDVDSTRTHIIRRVITTAMDNGHVPHETRRQRHGVTLVLSPTVDDLPTDDGRVVLAR
ncbi:hypothetical protein [Natrinema altunense]|uniref:Uncharacterized protein n=1 Tax=Natrinema altunense TaxID=222984 RepID=A0A482Y2Y4_9EURY|nr:hypothetical protein [Natrinema altunense]RZH68753.1 hypothetical protein ELS17_04635 [Natrinema altunense]